jgi:hypothetical protein
MQISTMNSLSTLAKGPRGRHRTSRVPLRRSLDGWSGGRWASAGEVAAADPAVGVRAEVPLELHQAPDPGPVDPQIGLDVDGRLLEDDQIYTKQLGTASQGSSDRASQGRVVRFPSGHAP